MKKIQQVLREEFRLWASQNRRLRDWWDDALAIIAVLATLVTVVTLSPDGSSLRYFGAFAALTLLVGVVSAVLVSWTRRRIQARASMYQQASWMVRVAEELRADDPSKILVDVERIRQYLDPEYLKAQPPGPEVERARERLQETLRILEELKEEGLRENPEAKRELRRAAADKLDKTAHDLAVIATSPEGP